MAPIQSSDTCTVATCFGSAASSAPQLPYLAASSAASGLLTQYVLLFWRFCVFLGRCCILAHMPPTLMVVMWRWAAWASCCNRNNQSWQLTSRYLQEPAVGNITAMQNIYIVQLCYTGLVLLQRGDVHMVACIMNYTPVAAPSRPTSCGSHSTTPVACCNDFLQSAVA